MSESRPALLARIASIEVAERARDAAIRARFEAGFGHPRGPDRQEVLRHSV